MTTGNNKADLAFKLIIGAVLTYVVFTLAKSLLGVITGITDSLTIGKSSEEERNKQEALAASPQKVEAVKYFTPAYGFSKVAKKYKTPNDYFIRKVNFSSTQADVMAKSLKNATGLFNDDENAIYSIMNQIPSLACLSLLSFRFHALYPKEDLFSFLSKALNGEELETVIFILSKKPSL